MVQPRNYNIEYAATSGTRYAYTDASYNGLSRYACNTIITTDASLNKAKDTYKKLYDIYSTQDPNSCVSFTSNNNCMGSICPHDPSIWSTNSVPNANPNAYYYTQKTCGSNNNPGLAVKDLAGYLDDCGAQIRTYNTSNQNNLSYKTDVSNSVLVDASFNSLLQTRNDLDNKMNELLGNNPNSILYENQNQLDASIYTTLLWTVLVTSSLYYIFTKI